MSISRVGNPHTRRELIVVLKPETGVLNQAMPAASGAGSTLLAQLANRGATIKPLLQAAGAGRPPAMAQAGVQAAAQSALGKYHAVSASDQQLDELQAFLASHPAVESAYIKPAAEPATLTASPSPAAPVPVTTPDFSVRQDYLGASPVGVDAFYAWTLPGGRGTGVKIIDCEWAWNFAHEDLAAHCNGAVVGTPDASGDDHGTAVIGEIIGNDNGFGITGIAPGATLATAAFSEPTTSQVIIQAANQLAFGDILLLEIHRPGPLAPTPANGQQGFIAIEWWPDDYQAIAYATSRGILVVEAAGNGFQNLDDPAYNIPSPGFPSDWLNPFAAGGPNSGAIVVGAGNPPANTHGRTQDTLGFNESYLDRARCVYSNYGSRVDCQGWGWEVTTLGYGDLQPGTSIQPGDHNTLYTDVFAGTSSASPIITGVLACIQGALRANGSPLLTPATAKAQLRNIGAPQQSAPGRPATQRIGSRPDLKAILNALGIS